MPKMDKDDVIYGGDSAKVPVAKVNWTALQHALEQAVGPDTPVINLTAAKTTVAEAKAGKGAAKTYVKLGLVGKDMVLRVKTPGTLTDTEVDTILVKGAKAIMERVKAESRQTAKENIEKNEQSKTSDVQVAAAEHLALRKRMVNETAALKGRADAAVNSLTELEQRALAHVQNVRDNKGNTSNTNVKAGVLQQLREQGNELYNDLQKRYKAMTKDGSDLMASRKDFSRLLELPPTEQGDYKRDSGVFFRQATANMEDIGHLISQARNLDGAVEEYWEEVDALASGMSPTKALVRLEDIRTDAGDVLTQIDMRHGKLTSTLDREGGTWKTIIEGGDDIKTARQRSYNMKVVEIDKLIEVLKTTKGPLDRIKRRIAALRQDVMDDRTVAATTNELQTSIREAEEKLRTMPRLIQTFRELKIAAEHALA